MDEFTMKLALILFAPSLLGFIVVICNEISYSLRKRDNTRHKSSSSQTHGQSEMQKIRALYHSLSPSSRVDTIQSKLYTMRRTVNENRNRMTRHDIETCEEYIRKTQDLLSSIKQRDARQKQERAARQRSQQGHRTQSEEHATFVAEQRRLMTASLRYDVMKRDGFRCQLCGATAQDGVKLHVDHIYPVSKGGKTEMSNLRTLCDRCNMGKRDKIESPTAQPIPEVSYTKKWPNNTVSSQALIESSRLRQLVAAYPSVRSFIAELQKYDVQYVDNRELGGCFWVEGNPDTDAVMPHITVLGAPMRHTPHCKCFGGKPSWFISGR